MAISQNKAVFFGYNILPHFYPPPQDISASVCLTSTGLVETLSLPAGLRGGAGCGYPQFTLCVLSTLRLFCKIVNFFFTRA